MKLVAIDGNSLINRAFYGVRSLCNSKGFPTNAIYGFLTILNKIIVETQPTHAMVAFDLAAETFRHIKFKDYKAGRKKMPQELFLQLVEVKKMLKYMGFRICETEGFEADDLLGTISQICTKNKVDCVICSGDRDVLQLVGKYVKVRLSTNKSGVWFNEASVIEKYGINSRQLIDVKALMGDASDNIPGVRGIGEKTALKLILQRGSVEKIFEDIDGLEISQRVKNLLKAPNASQNCYLSRELGTIKLDVDLNDDLSFYLKKEVDWKNLKAFFEKFELKKFLNIFNRENSADSCEINEQNVENADESKFEIFENESIELVKKKLQNCDSVVFLFYDDALYVFDEKSAYRFDENFKLEAFKILVVSNLKPKKTTNLKQVYKFSLEHDLSLQNVVFSCDIASYLIDVLKKNHDVLSLTQEFFGCDHVIANFSRVCSKLEQQIKQNNLERLLLETELPLAELLAEMEISGFCVDLTKLEEFGEFLNKKIEQLKNEIWGFCGKQFNINSTKELANVLFNDLKLPRSRKTKTGFSTDAEALKKLVKHSEVVSKILDYRTFSKLLSTYVHGLQKVVGTDGRVHSNFNQIQTRTGRISSTEPNIQNIPIKTEIGSEIRRCFVADAGKVLVDCDYSQIELRILAEMAHDEKMIDAFNSGVDIHSLTASHLFGLPVENVSDELRRRAKTVNFSIIYGIGAFSLAKDIGVSVVDARKYIESFFENFKSVKAYFDGVVERAKQTGQVETMFGRIRKIPELFSKSKRVVALGERIAKNTPIQGTCADLTKIAMIRVQQRFKAEKTEANLILQVHDELLVETTESCADLVAKILKYEMENVASLKVPLVAEVTTGKDWFSC